jgi:hypothetical protein
MTRAFGCVPEGGVGAAGAEVESGKDGLGGIVAEGKRFVQCSFHFGEISRILGKCPGEKGERFTQIEGVSLFAQFPASNLRFIFASSSLLPKHLRVMMRLHGAPVQ